MRLETQRIKNLITKHLGVHVQSKYTTIQFNIQTKTLQRVFIAFEEDYQPSFKQIGALMQSFNKVISEDTYAEIIRAKMICDSYATLDGILSDTNSSVEILFEIENHA